MSGCSSPPCLESDDHRLATKAGDAVITESTGISGPWDSLFDDLRCSDDGDDGDDDKKKKEPPQNVLFAGDAGVRSDAGDAGDAGDGATLLPLESSLENPPR